MVHAHHSPARAQLDCGALGIHQLLVLHRVRTLLSHLLPLLLALILLEVMLGWQHLLRLGLWELVAGQVRLAERGAHFSIADQIVSLLHAVKSNKFKLIYQF